MLYQACPAIMKGRQTIAVCVAVIFSVAFIPSSQNCQSGRLETAQKLYWQISWWHLWSHVLSPQRTDMAWREYPGIFIFRYRLGRDLARTKMPGPSWWNVMKSPKLSETQRFSGKFRLKRENGFGLRYCSFSFFGPSDIANTTTWQIGWSLWLWLNYCCDFLQYGIWTELDIKIGRFSLI